VTQGPSVVVVGAGPTGLMLGCELALAGVPCRILERRQQESNLTRAFGVHARTLELLDIRGEADKLVSQGLKVPEVRPQLGRRPLRLSLNHPESRFPYVLIVAQARTEALLEQRARALGVQIVLGAEVVGLRQDDAGVEVVVDAPEGRRAERADYVVGCDGAHSAVRRLSGVGFVGSDYSTHIMLADIYLPENLPTAVGAYLGRAGIVLLPPFGDGWYRAVIWDREREHVPLEEPLGTEEIRQSLCRIAGTDFGMRQMRWSTRFLSERRQADRYRVGRTFLAGDAAHVHSPLGALGMNTGIQDAMNLGWKLSAAVHGWAPPWLLDTYHSERHPVGRAALQVTDLLQRVTLAPAPIRAVRPLLARFALSLPPVRRTLRRRIAGISIAYPPPPRQQGTPVDRPTRTRRLDRRLPSLPEHAPRPLHVARPHRERPARRRGRRSLARPRSDRAGAAPHRAKLAADHTDPPGWLRRLGQRPSHQRSPARRHQPLVRPRNHCRYSPPCKRDTTTRRTLKPLGQRWPEAYSGASLPQGFRARVRVGSIASHTSIGLACVKGCTVAGGDERLHRVMRNLTNSPPPETIAKILLSIFHADDPSFSPPASRVLRRRYRTCAHGQAPQAWQISPPEWPHRAPWADDRGARDFEIWPASPHVDLGVLPGRPGLAMRRHSERQPTAPLWHRIEAQDGLQEALLLVHQRPDKLALLPGGWLGSARSPAWSALAVGRLAHPGLSLPRGPSCDGQCDHGLGIRRTRRLKLGKARREQGVRQQRATPSAALVHPLLLGGAPRGIPH
jgi:2-polyprenyl-6-methoxyphenol hydroxylase-like FAD-dependent oxidoreductase